MKQSRKDAYYGATINNKQIKDEDVGKAGKIDGTDRKISSRLKLFSWDRHIFSELFSMHSIDVLFSSTHCLGQQEGCVIFGLPNYTYIIMIIDTNIQLATAMSMLEQAFLLKSDEEMIVRKSDDGDLAIAIGTWMPGPATVPPDSSKSTVKASRTVGKSMTSEHSKMIVLLSSDEESNHAKPFKSNVPKVKKEPQ